MKYVLQSTLIILLTTFLSTFVSAQIELSVVCPESFTKAESSPRPTEDPLYGMAVLVLPEASTTCLRPAINLTWLRDNESIPIDAANPPVVDGFTTHDIVIIVRDACSNVDTCRYTISITRPEVRFGFANCPTDTTVYVVPGDTAAVVVYDSPLFDTNCTPPTDFELPADELASGNSFPLGTSAVEFRATNGECGEAVCAFTITIEEASLTIDCPEDFTKVEEFPDSPFPDFGIAELLFPTATTTCPTDTSVSVELLDIERYNLTSEGIFTVAGFQMHEIHFQISDACGNLDTCSYTLNITRPEADIRFENCPTDTIVVELARFETFAVVDYSLPTPVSNCFLGFEFYGSPDNRGAGGGFPIGIHTEEYFLNAPCGGDFCNIVIDVQYNEGPLTEFTDCPESFTKTESTPIDTGTDPLYGLARIEVPELFVACEFGGDVFLIAPTNTVTIDGERYVSGFETHEVVFLGVGNACGEIDTCAYTITIERPEIAFSIENCPSDTLITLAMDATGVVFDYVAPTLQTNCPDDGTMIADPNNIGPGGFFPIGTHTERFTAMGECGETVCSFDVVVIAENTSITVDCPASFTKTEDPISIGQLDYGIALIELPVASTNCPDPVVNIELLTEEVIDFEGQAAVEGFQVHDIVFRITDNCGNSEICSYTIGIVRPDLVFEIGFCPPDELIQVSRGANGAIVNYIEPQINTNCPDPNFTLTVLPVDAPRNGQFFPVGTTTLTYVFSSPFCGNVSCEFDIVVEEEGGGGSEGVDLELQLNTEAVALERYHPGDFQFELRNNGTETATGIEMFFKFDVREIVPVGSFQPIASHGAYRPVARRWVISELAAGEIATLDIRLFAKMAGASFQAEISKQDQEDFDSTPGNAIAGEANEDDEIYFKAIIIEPPFELSCPESFREMQVLPLSLDDPFFGKAIIAFPTASTTSCVDTTVHIELLNTENISEMDGFPVVEGFQVHELHFRISDNCGNVDSCSYSIRLTMPALFYRYAYCPEDIMVKVAAGTSKATVYYPEPIFQTNCPEAVSSNLIANSMISGSMFPLGTSTIDYGTSSVCGTESCSFNITVETSEEAPTDLELDLRLPDFDVEPFVSTTSHFVIRNTSNVDADGVQFKLNVKAGELVQVGETRATLSQGEYLAYIGFWDVGSIAAGDSATLSMDLYIAKNEFATIYAQILSADNLDADSVPGNGNCCTPTEDDEVAFTIRGELSIDAAELTDPNTGSQLNLFPNPAHEQIEIIYAFEQIAHSYLIFDINGRVVERGLLGGKKGSKMIDISALQKGMYYLKINADTMQTPMRFVKI